MKNFPSQLISDSKKDDKWCEQMLDAIISYAGDGSAAGSTKSKDISNYEIYNGKFKREDYSYLTEQYGANYPARLVNYPIVQPKIDLLLGEDLHRPLDTKVVTINQEAINRKEDHKVTMVMNKLLEEVRSEMEQLGMEVNAEGQDIPIPEDIDTFMRYNYRESIEESVQDGLEFLVNSYKIKNKFKEGFRDLLITGKECFRVAIKDGDPQARRVDPRSLSFDLSEETDDLGEANWITEERWLSPSDIVDEFGDSLSDEDIKLVESIAGVEASGITDNSNWVSRGESGDLRVKVVHAEWRSLKKIQYKLSENKHDNDKPFKKVVSDVYKKRKGEKVRKVVVDDIWQATKIAGKILVNGQRVPNQIRSIDDPSAANLSYVGVIRNHTTGSSVSMVDLLRNVQALYNIVMYHIELSMARAGGKAVVYDVAQMPANLGMNMQDVMYHIKNDGIIPINSKDEGLQAQTFNQFQQIDFTLSSSVQQLINLKVMLEDMAGQVSGVTKQREGQVEQYEQVGNAKRAVVQSATITRSWFWSHDMVKQDVLMRLANLMKISWAEGKKTATVFGDGTYKFISILPDVALNDYGVFLGDGGKDEQMKAAVTQLAQSALQGGQIDMLDVIRIYKSDTMTEAEHILERGLEAAKEMQAQQQEAAGQQAQAEAEAKAQEQQIEVDMNKLDNETRIKVAEIQYQSKLDTAEILSDDAYGTKRADAALSQMEGQLKGQIKQ
tara:strand:- start:18550 stop:20721 length:2172 start_codon:yes stop_codon:yes gene_type:complete